MKVRRQEDRFNIFLLLATRGVLALLLTAVLIHTAGPKDENSELSWFLFVRQDLIGIALVLAGIFAFRHHFRSDVIFPPRLIRFTHSLGFPVLCAVALVLACWAGHYFLFQGYDLSRDEQLANFDAWIISHGRLFWPLPAGWQNARSELLNQMFMLPIPAHAAWVSAYLPGNAALRSLVGYVADPALCSPLMVGIGAIALWRVAGRIWPNSVESAVVALLLYASTSQVLFTGMTAYAMSALLALNLVWLMLFLKDSRLADIAALLVGFVATGLHQPIFHPLFIAPFLLTLLLERRWTRAAMYLGCYGCICLFWVFWPVWIAGHFSHGVVASTGQSVSYMDRLVETVHFPGPAALALMALNLLRFIAWQHLLLVPLTLAGIVLCWKTSQMCRLLTAGLMLPLLVMLVLLPYQGHGWGYRYLHGVQGNAYLLAVMGWQSLRMRGAALGGPLFWSSLLSTALVLPVHAIMIRQMIDPYRHISETVDRSKADLAIFDVEAAPFTTDLVLNRPDLSNRPLRIMAYGGTAAMLAPLCKGRSVIVIGHEQMAPIRRFFKQREDQGGTKRQRFQSIIRQAGCVSS